MNHPVHAGAPPVPASKGPGKPAPGEEPEFSAEDDIPTEDAAVEADDESVAGEEDPGAALDTARPKPRSGAAG